MIIYKATNIFNGKIYIGQTTQKMSDRKTDHKLKAIKHNSQNYFHRAIRKYGIDNFNWEIIDTAKDRDELNEKEKYWIEYYNSINYNIGYNSKTGGNQPKFNDEIKIKIGLSGKGKKRSEEFKENLRINMSGKGNHFFGKKHTEETKEKISKSRKGVKGNYTPESLAKTIKKGSSNGMSKVNEETVVKIKIDIKNNMRNRDITKKYNISKSLLCGIKHNITWKHIKID